MKKYFFSPKKLSKDPWKIILDKGNYSAVKIAKLINWTQNDMAKYLNKNQSAVSRSQLTNKDQEALGNLIQLLDYALYVADGKLDALVAWLQTKLWAFGNKSAKDIIIEYRLKEVKDVLDEIEKSKSA